MRIILSGGGTIGSVSPLIAVYQAIKKQRPDTEFLWIGTRRGPEQRLVTQYGIAFQPIFSGKLRRYFSLKNFIDPSYVLLGFFQSRRLIKSFLPDVVLTAGGFVSVPLVRAAKQLRVPAVIHQQDVVPGLANRLMARSASMITAAFEKTRADFPKSAVEIVGNPVRADISAGSRERGYHFFGLTPELPTVLFVGGGTGAQRLNDLVFESLPELVTFCQVIHLTGGKTERDAKHSRYRGFEFLGTEMADAYAVADVVISRAGMSALSELAALGKAAILLPISNSHQEQNATEFVKRNAALQLDERQLTAPQLTAAVRMLLENPTQRTALSRNIATILPRNAAESIAELLIGHYG